MVKNPSLGLELRNGPVLRSEGSETERCQILLAGDFCPINRTEKAVLAGRTEEMVSSIASILATSDIAILNLEAPLTLADTPIRKTGPNLKGDPGCVAFLKEAGFTVANLANNHIRDMGSGAVLETMGILKANGIHSVGAGRNLSEATRPLILEFEGLKIAVLAYAENEFSIADDTSAGATGLDPIANLEQIRTVSSQADVTLVLVHGGNEYCPIPSPGMRHRYRAFARAGASAVVATHTHCPQGMEIVDGVPIVYSLGNFLFDTPYEAAKIPEDDLWWKGYMLKLEFSRDAISSIDLIPCSSGPDGTAVRSLDGEQGDEFLGYLQHLSDLIRDEEKVNRLWDAWCLKKGPFWIDWFRKARYPSNGIDGQEAAMVLRNGFTCEAHHEVAETFLRMICEDRTEAAAEYLDALAALQKGRY